MRKIDFEQIKLFLEQCDDNTRIYLGCDSERYRKAGTWMADYIRVIVVHKDGNNGCRLYGEVITETDFDQKKNRPTMRLMNEAYKLSELYHRVVQFFVDNDIVLPIEMHLDLNPDKKQVSNHVVDQAIGYIRGTCNITPKIKPESWSASYAADRFKDVTEKIKQRAKLGL